MAHINPNEKLIRVESTPSMVVCTLLQPSSSSLDSTFGEKAAQLAVIGCDREAEGSYEAADRFFRNAIAINSCPEGSSMIMAELFTSLGINLISMGDLKKAE